ncbi:MAG TPA: phosphoglucosamine mutase, partial [bacterium]|nr:phosphoglucosamine mutase [bacterium]
HDIDADAVMTKILKDQKKGRVDTVDGVKIIFEDGWIHFRKSNTEPIMRIIAEARTQERLDNMIQSFTSYFH